MSTITNEDWPLMPIEDVVVSLNQGWSPRCEKKPCDDNTQWGVLKTTAVQRFEFLELEHKKLPDDMLPREKIRVEEDDVLMTCAGPRNRVGIACHVEKINFKLMYSGKIYRIKVNQALLRPKFLVIVLNSPYYQDLINSMKTGINDSGLNLTQKKFKQLMIPIPSLHIQEKIEKEIVRSFSHVHQLEQTIEYVTEDIAQLQSSILRATSDGSLGSKENNQHIDGKNGESAKQFLDEILDKRRQQFLDENPGKKYREPDGPDIDGLPDIPDGWVWATTEQLSSANMPICYGVIKLGSDDFNGVPTLRSSDVKELEIKLDSVKKISKDIADDFSRSYLSGGEVVVAVRGTLGGICVVPDSCAGFNISREIAVIRPIVPEMAEYLQFTIASPQTKQWFSFRFSGIAYTGINIGTLRILPIPLPPYEEMMRLQEKCRSSIESLSDCHKLVKSNEALIHVLRPSILKNKI